MQNFARNKLRCAKQFPRSNLISNHDFLFAKWTTIFYSKSNEPWKEQFREYIRNIISNSLSFSPFNDLLRQHISIGEDFRTQDLMKTYHPSRKRRTFSAVSKSRRRKENNKIDKQQAKQSKASRYRALQRKRESQCVSLGCFRNRGGGRTDGRPNGLEAFVQRQFLTSWKMDHSVSSQNT